MITLYLQFPYNKSSRLHHATDLYNFKCCLALQASSSSFLLLALIYALMVVLITSSYLGTWLSDMPY